MPADDARTKIGDDSWVSLALFRVVVAGVIGAAITVIGAVVWATSVNAKLEANVTATIAAATLQENQGRDIAAIRDAMGEFSMVIRDVQNDLEDQWKLSDTIWWTAEFQRLNPNIPLPALGSMPSLMLRNGNERK